jgi:hypothetical protein
MRKQWVHPHKCRCGAWLYNMGIVRGHCTKCGPEDDYAHEPWCAVFVSRSCNCRSKNEPVQEDGADEAKDESQAANAVSD